MKISGSPSGAKGAGTSGPMGSGNGAGRASTAGTAGSSGSASNTPATSGNVLSAVGSSSAAVHLSQLEAQFAQSDFNTAKVHEITSAIANGSYRVNAGVVAEKLITAAVALAGPLAGSSAKPSAGRPQGS